MSSMGRPARIHYSGALFHVMTRGNNKQEIFLDDQDRISFTARLRRIKSETAFQLYAYCLMSNHIHLLLRVKDVSLSEIMQRLLTGYVREFNRKWDRRGRLFEDRFKWLHCQQDSYFRELVRYIHMNPVAAGLVEAPQLWPWTGYRELIDAERSDLIDASFVRSMIGPAEVIHDFTLKLSDFEPSLIEIDAAQVLVESPTAKARASPEHLDRDIAARYGLQAGAIRMRSKTGGLMRARREFILESAGQGYRLAEIARYLNRSVSVISRLLTDQRQRQRLT